MRLCFAISSDFWRNSRALRQVASLQRAGFSVRVVHLPVVKSELPPPPQMPELEVSGLHVPLPHGGPRFFLNTHRALSATLGELRQPFDHIHASDLYALPAAMNLARSTAAPVTFDSRELYTHVFGVQGKPWARAFWHRLQARYLPRTDRIMTVSEGIATHLADTYRINKPTVIPNVPAVLSRDHGPEIRSQLGLHPADFIAVHLGQIRAGRGCICALSAIGEIARLAPEYSRRTIHLAFVGDGPLKNGLSKRSSDLGIEDRVHFVPPVPSNDITTFVRTADVGLTLLPDSCLNHRLALPNKAFEYIGGGVPVVASALPELEKLIKDHELGTCVEPENPSSLAQTLVSIASDELRRTQWSQNCRRAAQIFNWHNFESTFLSCFVNVKASA